MEVGRKTKQKKWRPLWIFIPQIGGQILPIFLIQQEFNRFQERYWGRLGHFEMITIRRIRLNVCFFNFRKFVGLYSSNAARIDILLVNT